jgi:thymidylate kinase
MSKQLSDAEQQIYRKIEPPDAMILLNVSPEVSIQRKPDHQEEIIRLKTQTLAELGEQIQAKPGNLAFIAINADQPFEQVLLQVKREIWKLL